MLRFLRLTAAPSVALLVLMTGCFTQQTQATSPTPIPPLTTQPAPTPVTSQTPLPLPQDEKTPTATSPTPTAERPAREPSSLESADRQYLIDAHSQNISPEEKPGAIAMGKQACEMLGQGYSAEQTSDKLAEQKSISNVTDDGKTRVFDVFVTAAINNYCPQYKTTSPTTERPATEPSSSASTSPDSSAAPPATYDDKGRKVLGYGSTGYSLLKGTDGCIYVKGITEADLARMNTDTEGLKKVIKEETGAMCVLYE